MSTRSCPYAHGRKLDANSHVGPGRRGTYVHTYLARQRCRRGCKATATPAAPAAPMLLLFAKRCIILSAMLGISKRNTSGFAIVLRICSLIQRPSLSLSGSFRLSLSARHPTPSPSFCTPFSLSVTSLGVDRLVALSYKSCIAIDPHVARHGRARSANNTKTILAEGDVLRCYYNKRCLRSSRLEGPAPIVIT